MKLIIGLGNPGLRYQKTRHNIGRRVLEQIADTQQLSWARQRRLKAVTTELEWCDEEVVLAYPEVFMNQSGESVKKLVRHFNIMIYQDLLILLDDFALPFGRLKIRPQGGTGGHNGLKSIDQLLGSQAYARLRLGIGLKKDELQDFALEDYVLAGFSGEEEKALESVFDKARQACELWINTPFEELMAAVNTCV